MLSQVLTDAVCVAVLAFLWVQNRKRFAGTFYWVLDLAFQTAAALLILLRGSIPAWASIGVSSPLVVAGGLLGYMGLTRFVGRRSLQVHNYVALLAFVAVHLYFAFVQPSLAVRDLNVSLGLLFICFQCAWLLLRRVHRGMRRMTLAAGLVFTVFCLVGIVRTVLILLIPPVGNDFFRSAAFDTLLLMTYQMLLILLAFALALMINQRLFREVQIQEEKFTTAFRSSPYAITLTRLSDDHLIDVNDGFVTITGYSRAETTGKTALDLQLWARESDRAAMVSELSQGNRIVGREYQFRKMSGELMTGLFSAEIIRIDGLPWVLSSISDITERKRTEEALRESDDKFKHVFESANVGKSITLPTGEIVVNRAFCDLLGYTQEELKSRKWEELTAPEDIDLTQQFIDQLMKGEKDSVRFTKRFVHKNGSLVWVDLSSALRRDKEGMPLHLISTIVDITERKRAEEALRESEARFRTLIERAPVAVSVSRNGILLYGNQKLREILGMRDSEESVGRPIIEHYAPQCREESKERTLRRSHGLPVPAEFESIFLRVDGSQFPVHLAVAQIALPDGMANIAFVTDITDRKQAEEALRHAQKMETVGQLAGGVAHDFNNMLQVIISYVELSLAKVDPGQPLHKYLLQVRRAAQRSAEITGQLLAFARKQTVSPKVMDLNDAVAGAQKMIQRLIGEDIDLAWMPGHDLWRVKIDPVQLDQILANLAANARDAIRGLGKLSLHTEKVGFDEAYCASHPGCIPGEYVLLSVSDDGCGMDQETVSHLFEPFFTTKGVGKGTGLGLATVFGIIKQNDGFIAVDSEPGHGSTFRVYLPRAVGATEAERLEARAAAPRGGTETLLVVDDEAAILELSREMLEQLGYTVLTAGSPEEAMRRSEGQAGPIHLLITDVVMPQMNGRQLAERLIAARSGLRCLFISGYTANVIAHRGVLEEGLDFIAKPFSLMVLARKVREVLDAPAGVATPGK
jgi:PAS domain S-box-containing protein